MQWTGVVRLQKNWNESLKNDKEDRINEIASDKDYKVSDDSDVIEQTSDNNQTETLISSMPKLQVPITHLAVAIVSSISRAITRGSSNKI